MTGVKRWISALLAGANSIGIGHARGIDVAAIGFELDAADAVKIARRVEAFGVSPADFVKIHAVAAGLGLLQAQLMVAGFGLSQVEVAGWKMPQDWPVPASSSL